VEFALSDDDLDGFDDDRVLLPDDGTNHFVTFVAYVENDCEIDLVNVTITDPVLLEYGCTNFPAPFALKAGESASFELCVCVANCVNLPLTNRLMVTAQVDTSTGICGTHQDGGPIMVKCQSEAVVECGIQPPSALGVTKEVACYLPGDQCGPYGKEARGAKCDPNEPLFCYRIGVTNFGPAALTNVVVLDSELGDITLDILGGTTTLASGEGVSGTVIASAGQDTTNTVTVTAQSAATGESFMAEDRARVVVELARVVCVAFALSDSDRDGLDDDFVLLPGDDTNRL
jgi:hypothetical protein